MSFPLLTVEPHFGARGAKGKRMEQVPHWLEATIFAAGMTAYAEEVDGQSLRGIAADGPAAADDIEPPELLH